MQRSTTASVVAAFLLLATSIATLVAVSLLVPGTPLDRIWYLNQPAYVVFKTLGRVSGLLLLILGVCTAAAAFGLLRGRRWARWLAIGLFGANGIGDLVSMAISGDRLRSTAGALIAGAFVFLLVRRRPAP